VLLVDPPFLTVVSKSDDYERLAVYQPTVKRVVGRQGPTMRLVTTYKGRQEAYTPGYTSGCPQGGIYQGIPQGGV